MSNVKPGDLARVVVDPENTGAIGMQVLVLRAPKTIREELFAMRGVLYWVVQSLEMRRLQCRIQGDALIQPGEELTMADLVLRRIDPPADTTDIFSTEPLEGETIKDIHAHSS